MTEYPATYFLNTPLLACCNAMKSVLSQSKVLRMGVTENTEDAMQPNLLPIVMMGDNNASMIKYCPFCGQIVPEPPEARLEMLQNFYVQWRIKRNELRDNVGAYTINKARIDALDLKLQKLEEEYPYLPLVYERLRTNR